jgi:hypothetical protein
MKIPHFDPGELNMSIESEHYCRINIKIKLLNGYMGVHGSFQKY